MTRTYLLSAAILTVMLMISGCPGGGRSEFSYDYDGDGWEDAQDCGPENPSVHPGADDPYGDGIDQDCDGYDGIDYDGDTYPANVLPSHEDFDCDDQDPGVNPEAIEICDDGIDNDCDGGTDDEDFEDCEVPDEEKDWLSVSVGYDFTCGVHGDGTLECWGAAIWNPEGIFTSVSAGYGHICAIREDMTVECLGVGGENPPPLSFEQIAAGHERTCGIIAGGSIQCWGTSLGEAPPSGTFEQLDVGFDGCAVSSEGVLACWGNSYDDLAGYMDGYLEGYLEAYEVGMSTQLGCVLMVTGEVFCQSILVGNVVLGGIYETISVEGDSVCGITPDGEIDCGGDDDNILNSPDGDEFVEVTVGYEHACALTDKGDIECWGSNSAGQCNVPSSN